MIETMRKPTTFEKFAYDKLVEDRLYLLRKAAELVDQGKPSIEVIEALAGDQVLIGIWLFFAANYMIVTGIRPEGSVNNG